MSTPYDGKILLVSWLGRLTPGVTVGETAALIRQRMPNVAGIMLKSSNGVSWQGHLGDSGPKAITGVRRLKEWADAFRSEGLELHVWGVPRAKRPAGVVRSPDLEKEAEKFIKAATTAGVSSLLLDVELGPLYWLGNADEARILMQLIRSGVGGDTHIGLVLDGRRNRDFSFWVDPWIPFVDSLHPMVYPILFGDFQSIDQHLGDAFLNLGPYSKPIVPMLQAFAEAGRRPAQAQITQQGVAAWAKGATGISFFRLGEDPWVEDGLPHMGNAEYDAIAQIPVPTPATAVSAFTWQDVINATVTVASRNDADWNEWLTRAGFWQVFQQALRPRPYNGPSVDQWPLSATLRMEILELLGLDSTALAHLTATAQIEKEERDQAAAAKQRQQHGALVGIHGAPGAAPPPLHMWDTWIDFLKEMGIKWYKQCDNGDPNDLGDGSIFAWAKRLKTAGIEPIVRYLVSEQFPDSLPDAHIEKMRHYAQEGIIWAEIGNEPNLDIEWKSSWRAAHQPMRHTNPDVIRHVAETWVRDAQRALDAGVKPAFYAFAPTDWRGGSHPLYSSVFFTNKVVAYLAQHRRAATLDIFARGGWIAVHAATYEQPDDFDPFRPNGTVWDMTLRSYEVPLEAFRNEFGQDLDVDSLVVMSTEGGVFTPESTSMNGHERLGTNAEHAQRMVDMFRWLEQNSPLQAMCPWCISVGNLIGHFHAPFRHDGWFEEVNGTLRPRAVFEAMRQLRFDHEREEEQSDAAHVAVKLEVPYISQFDDIAGDHNADCGPTSLAMILNAGRPATDWVMVDALYKKYLPHKEAGDFTSIDEMLMIGNNEDVAMSREDYASGAAALENLMVLIEEDTPFVALVNYAKWDDVAQNNFDGGHFVVVTGFDEEHVLVHDPLFRGARRNKGRYFVWRHQKFLDGWGSGHEIGNPNYAALIPDKRVTRAAG